MKCDMTFQTDVAFQNIGCVSDLGPHAKNGLIWVGFEKNGICACDCHKILDVGRAWAKRHKYQKVD